MSLKWKASLVFGLCLLVTSGLVFSPDTAWMQDDWPALRLTVADQGCDLTPDDPYTLGPGCDNVRANLNAPRRDTLWMGLTSPDAATPWLSLSLVPGDPDPPSRDARGQFFGCVFWEMGDHLCRVVVEVNGALYQVEVPVHVGPPWSPPAGGAETTQHTAPAANAPPAPPATVRENPPPGTITTEYFPVYHCQHMGNDVFTWYAAEVTYQDGVAISEELVEGPFMGDWLPGCPAGEPTPVPHDPANDGPPSDPFTVRDALNNVRDWAQGEVEYWAARAREVGNMLPPLPPTP